MVRTLELGRLKCSTLIKRIGLDANFAVFLLFFGVAALEAFESGSWLKAVFWLAIGVMFLTADNHIPTPEDQMAVRSK